MPRRVKQDEKIEMIIRGLLKQEDNRRCINCNSLGPQYVCTTFWTFVCTNCSGVHREFNHRVKSVSMAKFNEEETMALQAGGNERAKQIYFKTWDPQRNSYPESGNLQRIREFVNHVYIERRYTGGNNSNKLSMVKLDSRSNSCEWPGEKPSWGKREDLFQRSSFERRSNSSRDDYHGRCSSERSSPSHNKVFSLKDFLEERSPRHPQATLRSSSVRSRSTHFEIVDDRFREDGGVKTYERNTRREPRSGSMSPCSQSSRTMSLPDTRPIKAILGEEVPELRVELRGGKDAESPARVEKAATIPGASGGNEKQNTAIPNSLIDFFDAAPELSSTPAEPQAHPTANNESSSSNQTAANTPNLLLEWSSPVASPSAVTKAPEISNSFGAHGNKSTNNDQYFHDNMMNKTLQEIQIHQVPSKQHSAVESLSNQFWNNSPRPNDPRPVRSVSLDQPSQAVNPGEGSAASPRKEIPQDLFTSKFPPFNPSVGEWPMHPSHGAGYSMQYHPPTMSASAFPNPTMPRNPFDIDDDRFQVQAGTFPSMSSLQGALPNQPSPYTTAPPSQPHASPYGMNMPLVPGAYMGQFSNNMQPTRPQGNANFGRSEDAFASLNPIRQTSGTSSAPADPTSSFPQVGNPFG